MINQRTGMAGGLQIYCSHYDATYSNSGTRLALVSFLVAPPASCVTGVERHFCEASGQGSGTECGHRPRFCSVSNDDWKTVGAIAGPSVAIIALLVAFFSFRYARRAYRLSERQYLERGRLARVYRDWEVLNEPNDSIYRLVAANGPEDVLIVAASLRIIYVWYEYTRPPYGGLKVRRVQEFTLPHAAFDALKIVGPAIERDGIRVDARGQCAWLMQRVQPPEGQQVVMQLKIKTPHYTQPGELFLGGSVSLPRNRDGTPKTSIVSRWEKMSSGSRWESVRPALDPAVIAWMARHKSPLG